ncbi:PREDICTED: RILP-like protein homolog [Priapulus caudatus]|uniref:RILP-like protein homolog n=1 Tax=Priapulus caudatus TaxID=37621 RepID=A0ABM1EPE1_PRICU|nr:PREDICTED: RILP-like protein homolog [Priapulus caudatus]
MDFDAIADITVVDVYESAAGIGREFEHIIDVYGTDAIACLMPKVITVLEQLEALAQRNERESAQISDLQFTVEKLEAHKSAKSSERMKFERELETDRESWRLETKE